MKFSKKRMTGIMNFKSPVNIWNVLICLFLLLVIIDFDGGRAVGKTLDIYVASDGTDNFDGSTPEKAVHSLRRVEEIVTSEIKSTQYQQIRVKFLPGLYKGYGIVWHTFPNIPIKFMPTENKIPVIFDGNGGRNRIFFRAYLEESRANIYGMMLEIQGLTIKNYCEGVSLGSSDNSSIVKGGNKIVDNEFLNIGNLYDPLLKKGITRGGCYAAVRLRGTTDNIISDNIFKNIISGEALRNNNKRVEEGKLLHAIYIAHSSHNNIISKNIFENYSGSPIRIRDMSNDNMIKENIFKSALSSIKNSNISVISQWYCNRDKRKCSRMECPSTGLEILDNKILAKNLLPYNPSIAVSNECQKLIPE